jgi:hypothetical protein
MARTDSNPVDARTVETLVREVLARLQANGMQTAPAQAAPAAGELIVHDAVVSTHVLADRLSGVRKVLVTSKAILTPAARDLLKQHQITLGRSAASTPGSKPSLVVGMAETPADPADLLRMVSPLAGGIERLAKTGMATVVAELADAVAKDGRLGLLLCGQPLAAACLANRQAGVRAAVARDRDEVVQGVGTLGMNLLIVDPARRSVFQLGQMVKQFLQSGPPRCPAGLKEVLR